jgi:hypothetical protein
VICLNVERVEDGREKEIKSSSREENKGKQEFEAEEKSFFDKDRLEKQLVIEIPEEEAKIRSSQFQVVSISTKGTLKVFQNKKCLHNIPLKK